MEAFAYHVAEQIGFKLPPDGKLEDLSQRGQRYSMYKVGPVISVSVSIFRILSSIQQKVHR